jgi:hypothetical protein
MKTRTNKTIILPSGSTYTFESYTGDTKNGFSHNTTFKNYYGYIINKTKFEYLNRTWECFEYQTTMIECVLKAYKKNMIPRQDAIGLLNEIYFKNGCKYDYAPEEEVIEKFNL